jgi:hypothetical protein
VVSLVATPDQVAAPKGWWGGQREQPPLRHPGRPTVVATAVAVPIGGNGGADAGEGAGPTVVATPLLASDDADKGGYGPGGGVSGGGGGGGAADGAIDVPPEWARDGAAVDCGGCGQPFHAVTRRRHHCRCCGEIFCAACTPPPLVRLPPAWEVLGTHRCCGPCATAVTSQALPENGGGGSGTGCGSGRTSVGKGDGGVGGGVGAGPRGAATGGRGGGSGGGGGGGGGSGGWTLGRELSALSGEVARECRAVAGEAKRFATAAKRDTQVRCRCAAPPLHVESAVHNAATRTHTPPLPPHRVIPRPVVLIPSLPTVVLNGDVPRPPPSLSSNNENALGKSLVQPLWLLGRGETVFSRACLF